VYTFGGYLEFKGENDCPTLRIMLGHLVPTNGMR